MPKLNLYRNISLTFVVLVLMLVVAIFLFFSSQATIIITPKPQKISLSFNLEVKDQPTAAELSEKDLVAGQIASYTQKGSAVFEVLSTKSVDAQIVGQVKIINQSNRDQVLVKTTQLQAANGVIVRTNDNLVVPAGGSSLVSVFAKEPTDFKAIDPGQLVIIKLNPSLQDKIYALAEKQLNNDPQEVPVLTDSDLARAKDKLSQELIANIKKDHNISDNSGFISQIKSFKIDKKLGEETSNFTLEMELEAKVLQINEEQLAKLLLKKISALNLSGLALEQINISDVAYTVLAEDLDGSVLVKVNYALLAEINESNAILNKDGLLGQPIKKVEEILSQEETVSDVEIMASPYWSKNLPKQAEKINIIIK